MDKKQEDMVVEFAKTLIDLCVEIELHARTGHVDDEIPYEAKLLCHKLMTNYREAITSK